MGRYFDNHKTRLNLFRLDRFRKRARFNPNRKDQGFLFSDSDAEAYYDALAIANGGDIDSVSLYSISLDTLKAKIDDLYIALKSDGSFGQMLYQLWFVGGTSVTHAINGVDGSSLLTYIGSPTHDGTGMILNGSTQHANVGNNPSVDYITTSNHLLMFVTPISTTSYSMGCRNGTSQGNYFRQSGGAREYIVYNTGTGRVTVTTSINHNKLHIASRISAVRADIYNDGSSIGFITGSGGVLPTLNQYLGAWNNNGVTSGRMQGTMKAATLGAALTSSQAANVTTAIKNFNTSLGR